MKNDINSRIMGNKTKIIIVGEPNPSLSMLLADKAMANVEVIILEPKKEQLKERGTVLNLEPPIPLTTSDLMVEPKTQNPRRKSKRKRPKKIW